jgi:hypothetical protein
LGQQKKEIEKISIERSHYESENTKILRKLAEMDYQFSFLKLNNKELEEKCAQMQNAKETIVRHI